VSKTPKIYYYQGIEKIIWYLEDDEGNKGEVDGDRDDFSPVILDEDGSETLKISEKDRIYEQVKIDRINHSGDFVELHLTSELENIYLRRSVRINANVAQATHGETKTEVLGSGNGSKTFQSFNLRQSPLTFISSDSSSGMSSTLEIRVNGILWKEVSSLYGRGPDEEVYTTSTDEQGITTIMFGDGRTGARLPTGSENIKATFRVGSGLEGLVDGGKLSLLMSPQIGLSKVNNPLAATGGDQPEQIEKARKNAPLTTLTLNRIVSLSDFEAFARAFGGIEKARADLIWNGERQMVHLTLAAPKGNPLSSNIKDNLIQAIDNARHVNYPVKISNFKEVKFHIKAKIFVDPVYKSEEVVRKVEELLKSRYCFDQSEFGLSLSPSQAISIIQSVHGVTATDLDFLTVNASILNAENQFIPEHYRIFSKPAYWDEKTGMIIPAELLIIEPGTLKIIPTAI
jgi:predicted phage baseplate assembly protein